MADDKVVSLWGNEIPENGAYPSVVKELEDWLERAKRGEFVSVAVVGVRPDMNVCNTLVLHSGPQDMALIGGLTRATYRILGSGQAVNMGYIGDGDAPP